MRYFPDRSQACRAGRRGTDAAFARLFRKQIAHEREWTRGLDS
jgi:hypothetical protein